MSVPSSSLDGRRLRGERTRQPEIPAAARIAGRAGISTRSIFERFAGLELMYRPELDVLSDEERRDPLIALESVIDFASRGRMHEFHGLPFDEACSVWSRTIDRLLPPTPQLP